MYFFDNVVLECFDEFDIKRVMTEDFYIQRWFMHVFDMPGDQIDTCTNNMIKALRWRKDENIRGMYSINCKFLVFKAASDPCLYYLNV